ncbi:MULTISPECIES: gephyrin-like molybdotransferase Glp [unclassified Nitratiruptor]|uniref:molybdopterin molybdotransferase MoeA n=1 Tax=unclassified Nitratiruptor TaxID=2624044 RepID=UPI0019164AC9|nr:MULTISPECIES: gephyrin-like molybdotransferase Glp [unclassified Nitratiruptor]BCD60882.1 molybdopterin molybdotransferase [Nitratiruptor sp. YY08-10]BCD64814.1 molybdopterin molybdotransferase [Nitratiruptor sp. YY08-14]
MAISIIEALNIIDALPIRTKQELLCIEDAVGRIATQDVYASLNLPLFDNSAMDGFAVKVEDAGKQVKLAGTVLAGEDKSFTLQSGECIKIMTGAKIPEGTEAIVPIEDVTFEGNMIHLPKKIKLYNHIRKAGEDIEQGEKLIQKGEYLNAYKIGLLASQGISHIQVYKRIHIAIFATGHELKMAYETLEEGQIYNSNTPSLYARCKELGCDVSFLGKVEDSIEAIVEAIKNGLHADIIITSGGVSVGEADFTKDAFKQLGMEILFSKIDIKPGKPTTLGKIGNTYVLNLPGNPLAAIINFEIFGRFLIKKLQGRIDAYHQPFHIPLAQEIKNKPGRDTAIPGRFDGEAFYPLDKRGPGMVRPASLMDGYIILDKDVEILKKGKKVLMLPLFEHRGSDMMLQIITS